MDEIASADLTILISETENAINKADETAKAERANALDPVLSPDATAAREAMQAASSLATVCATCCRDYITITRGSG